jgi:hypothetical protein
VVVVVVDVAVVVEEVVVVAVVAVGTVVAREGLEQILKYISASKRRPLLDVSVSYNVFICH